jgi:hypothetical protein
MSFVSVAVGVVGEGIAANMLAGAMMGATTTVAGNVIGGRGAFDDIGRGIVMGGITGGLTPGVSEMTGFGMPASAGLIQGGLTTLATGSLSRGLAAGMGAYGMYGLADSVSNMGANSLTGSYLGDYQGALAEQGFTPGTPEFGEAARKMVTDARGAMPIGDKMSAGIDLIKDKPGAFLKDNLRYLTAAAAPIMADAMIPTTTKAPFPQTNATIREKRWNGRYFEDVANTDANVFSTSGRSFSDPYRGYNNGGIVALAAGGVPDYFLANPDVAKAFAENAGGYATGLNAQQYADLHYKTHGAAEVASGQRAPTTLSNAAQYALDNDVTNLGLNEGQLTALARNPEMNLSELDVAGTQFGVNAYNPTSPLIHGYQVANDQTAAAEAYLADKKNADILAYLDSEAGRKYLAANPQFDRADVAFTHFQRFGEDEGRTWGVPKKVTPVTPLVLPTTPLTNAPPGTTNPYGNVNNPGDLTYNPDGTTTVTPNIPGRPYGGFPGMGAVKDAYTAGGGSLGYKSPSFNDIESFNAKYVNRMSGDSRSAYDYLTGKAGATYPIKSGVGQISRPYDEAVLGYPARGNLPYTYNKDTGKMDPNPDYVAPGRDAKGNVTYSMSLNDIKSALKDAPLTGQALYDWAIANNLSAQQIADATGRSLSSVYSDFRAGSKAAADKKKTDEATETPVEVVAGANGGMMGYAVGGGLGSLGSYSDGGRLLKGPGDGVSDSIPATIGRKRQPARLADGEFVIPARIVSELGNGSTEAGAKKLYAMMDRVQRARGKTTGKNKVAANSRADKYLPA